MLTYVDNIYNELQYIYKNKYNKKINSLFTKNRKKFDYKKLRLTDDYLYLSEKEQEEIQEKTITDANAFNEWIIKKEAPINSELFMKHFNFQNPSDMLKNLYQINNKVVNVINSGLKDLKEKIKEMSEEERKVEETDKIVKIVEDILRFIKQKQEGEIIKILTPNQMLCRLPISLAQLKAGNSSEKIKNEIRQLLYSIYRSKNMTKQVYNNIIKPI